MWISSPFSVSSAVRIMKHSSLHYKPGIIFSFQLLRRWIEDIAFYLLYTNVIFLGYGVFCLVVRWRLKIMMHCWGMWQNDISSWLFILCPRVNILCSNCVQTVKCGYSNGIGAVWGVWPRMIIATGPILADITQTCRSSGRFQSTPGWSIKIFLADSHDMAFLLWGWGYIRPFLGFWG